MWTKKATLMITEKYNFTELYMKLLPGSGGYKSTTWRRELRHIHTHRPHTMGSKAPEPWSPQWVRQKLRKDNGLSSNDPNHDEKPPAGVEKPLCKCDFDCQSHINLDYDTYGRRYWSCPQPTCPFHWGWDEEKLWKVVSVVTFKLHILKIVIIDHFWRVFALRSSHCHRNHWDVISNSGLMTIWHWRI
jgi:hypothetical protein